ncbi:hypothetical protein SNK04_002820 [Fusarium graminearum]
MATEDRGNMMYISPESYANFFERDLVKTDVPPTSYIWALGALFSDVLVWSIHGEAGRYKYRQARKKEISRHPQMIAVEHGACFHNGFQRLTIVDKFLESVLADRPSNDEVSSAIGHMILNFMMTNEKDRLRAVEIKSLIKSIAEKAHQPNSSSYEAQVAKIHESRIQQSLSATITSSSDDGTSDTSSLYIWSEPEYMAGATLLSSAPDTQNLVSSQGGHGSSPKIIDIYGYQIRAPHGDIQSEDQEEIQSLISLDEDIQSNQSGISSLRAYQVASKLLVERFLEDDHLLALYQEAVKRLDMKRFINNHTTLLKRYFLDLRAAVKSRTEEISVDFLRSQRERERISSVIYDLVLKQGEQVRQIVKMEIKDNQESFRLVDRFLAEQEDYDHEDTTYSDPESSDSSDDPPSPKEQTSQGESSKLEAVATFMTVGSAFESYKYNLDEFLHPRKRGDKDPSIILAETSPTALTTSQYARKIARGFSWLMKITRPRVKKGYRRLEWTCDCGSQLYADFIVLDEEKFQQFVELLQGPPPVGSQGGIANAPSSQGSSSAKSGSPNSNQDSPNTSSHPMSSNTVRPPGADTPSKVALPPGSGRGQRDYSTESPESKSKYLAICVQTGPIYTTLEEVDTSSFTTDATLLKQMKSVYTRIRGMRTKYNSFFIPVGLEFVKVRQSFNNTPKVS